jgi:hypothetical protein
LRFLTWILLPGLTPSIAMVDSAAPAMPGLRPQRAAHRTRRWSSGRTRGHEAKEHRAVMVLRCGLRLPEMKKHGGDL